MAAPTSLRSCAVAVMLALPAVGALTPAAGVEAVPGHQAGERFPEPTVTAIVGDVDGDGIRELVRLGPLPDDGVHLGVEVISADQDGRTTRHGMAGFRRLAGVEEQLEGPTVVDERGMAAVRVDDPARLLVWRVRGHERVLVVSIGTRFNPRACCLTLGEVGLHADGRTVVVERAAIPESGTYILAADLDDDGTDELVVAEPRTLSAPAVTPVYVLRWVDSRFIRIEGDVHVAPGTSVGEQLVPLGNSDGRPGDEIGLLADDGSPNGASLDRVSLNGGGGLRIEHAQMPSVDPLVPIRTSEGGRLLVGTLLLDWPAGAPRPVLERRSEGAGIPVAVLGARSTVRVLLLNLLNGRLQQLDDRLRVIGITRRMPLVDVFDGTDLFPFSGRLPGGLDGSGAFVHAGGLLVSGPRSTADLPIEARPIATMAAATPIGTFGPGGMLTALAEGPIDATREGGQLEAQAGPRPGVALTAAKTATVLSAEADEGILKPAVTGAVLGDSGAFGPVLLTRDGFIARIAAPPGSRVLISQTGESQQDAGVVPRDGQAEIPIVPRGLHPTVRVVVITPSGHGYVANWNVRVLNQPPSLEASLAPGSFGFSIPVLGQTDPGATVTVDGHTVVPSSDGSFAVEVGVGLIPREVDIRATDVVGNVASQRVSVVGPFDYRQLPWIPIVVALTIVAGAILYLRVPRASPAPPRPPGDDAVLEEIE